MRSERGLDRLVNFSDAVVAIAITIIVLPLVDLAGQLGSKNVGQFLLDNGYGLLAAGLSFVVIGSFWREHHTVFDEVGSYNGALVTTNLVWLASIVFLPMPTVLLVNARSDDAFAYGLYIGTMVVTMVASRLMTVIIARSSLRLKGSTARVPNPLLEWLPVLFMVIALVLAVSAPAVIGMKSLLIFLLMYPINRIVHTRLRRRERVSPQP